MKKHMSVSNVIYAISIIFALGVLLKVYLDRSSLPEGVCPTDYNSELIYLSIGILIASTIVTSVLDRRSKKARLAAEAQRSDDDTDESGDGK